MLRSDVSSRRLICFFDINDTMFIGDSAKNVSKRMSIMKLLAEHYVSVWNPEITTEPMTYRHFIEKHSHPGDRRIPEIQEQHNKCYDQFLEFLEASGHELASEVKVKFSEISAALKDGCIPQSFIRMVHFLDDNHYPYTIIFRSFGNDIDGVKKELAQTTSLQSLNHADIKSGTLYRDDTVFTTPEEILNSITIGEHGFWQDNFRDWRATGESYHGGKPFPFAFDRDDIVTVFFDDNVHKKILHAMPVSGEDCDQESLQQWLIANGVIVPVDTFSVCTDPDYFINKVKAVYQNNLSFSQYLPLSDNGNNALDEAIFLWAVQTLNPDANLNLAANLFSELADAYQDKERYFHRGLGHPRSLLPDTAQLVYKLFLQKASGLQTKQLLEKFSVELSAKLPDMNARIREAREVLAAFYHDVVHRRGKNPVALPKYKNTEGLYTLENLPLSHNIICKSSAEKVEERSCMVAEDALQQLYVPDEDITAILLAIYATIPFSETSKPKPLRSRMITALTALDIPHVSSQVDDAVDAALHIANRDLGSYGADTLNEFDKKTWAMMFEREPSLAASAHSLADEANTIAVFYALHKKLSASLDSGKDKIYYSRIEDPLIEKHNQRALALLKQDVILLGVQLAALTVTMSVLDKIDSELNQKPIDAVLQMRYMEGYLNSLVNADNTKKDIPDEIKHVLSQHGSECMVNGNNIMRGNVNSKIALLLANIIGVDKMLVIADQYQIDRSMFNPISITKSESGIFNKGRAEEEASSTYIYNMRP